MGLGNSPQLSMFPVLCTAGQHLDEGACACASEGACASSKTNSHGNARANNGKVRASNGKTRAQKGFVSTC